MREFIKEVRLIYSKSYKKDRYLVARISRPFASLFLYFVKDTRITPNQISLLSVFTTFCAAAILVMIPTYTGSIIGGVIFQLAFVFDCADGQLARLRNQHQEIGHLVDELSGYFMGILLFSSTSIHVYRLHNNIVFLLVGIFGLSLMSSGYALNMFVRQKEYAPYFYEKRMYNANTTGKRRRLIRYIVQLRFALTHFPSYFLILAIVRRLQWYLVIYTIMSFLVCSKRMSEIIPRLCRFEPKLRLRGGDHSHEAR